MSAIIEAIDATITELDAKAARLRALRQIALAAENGGGGPFEQLLQGEPIDTDLDPRPDPPPSIEVEVVVDDSKVAQAAVEVEAPRKEREPTERERESAATRDGRASATAQRAQRILDFVRQHPKGVQAKHVHEAVASEVTIEAVRNILNAQCSKGTIKAQLLGKNPKQGKMYVPAEADVAPKDDTGCRTEVERKCYAAVAEAKKPPTTVMVAEVAGCSVIDAGNVLWGLQRRNVLRAVPLRTDSAPQTWAIPVG